MRPIIYLRRDEDYFAVFDTLWWWFNRWDPEVGTGGACRGADSFLKAGRVEVSWRGHSLILQGV